MNAVLPDATVSGYENLIPGIALPDPDGIGTSWLQRLGQAHL